MNCSTPADGSLTRLDISAPLPGGLSGPPADHAGHPDHAHLADRAGDDDRFSVRAVRVIAAKELRDALRDRWLWLYGGAFVVLATTICSMTASEATTVGFVGFGRTASSLVALSQLVIPLMGLTVGARSICGQRERGTLAFLLAHPVRPTELFLGVFIGSVLAMFAAISAGFGAAGLASVVQDAAVDGGSLVLIALLSWLLAVAMIGVGMVVSVASSKTSTALGGALVLWLVFVLFGNLGLMGTSVATTLSPGAMFAAAAANPVESFRLSTMTALGGSLDVLGPVGVYAVDRFGDAVGVLTATVIVVWALVPAWLAALLFRRSPLR